MRQALRALWRARGFTFVAVAALAVGIGANTAVFSLVHTVLLRPLPFAEPDRLVLVTDGPGSGNVTPPDFVDWRAARDPFVDLAAFAPVSQVLNEAGDPERIVGQRVTANLFGVLGVTPSLGMVPGPEGDEAGGPRDVVISDGLWRARFGEDRGIIGRSILLDGEPYTVRAVMPATFNFPVEGTSSYWVSMQFTPAELAGRGAHFLTTAARLRPEVSLDRARAAMDLIAERMRREYPRTNGEMAIAVTPLSEAAIGDARRTLLLLWGAVGFVLLIACANVASMQLARGAQRRREIAVRAALGAGARRIVAQLLGESILLSLMGGVLGLAVAWVGVRLLTVVNPGDIARFHTLELSPLAFVFAFAASALAGVAFGTVPALVLRRTDPQDALRAGDRGSTAGRFDRWYRASLVVAEIGLAVILVIGAGLLIRSLRNLTTTDLGFEPAAVLTMSVELPRPSYPGSSNRAAFFDQALARVTALPGVQAAGAISFLPLAFQGGSVGITAEGEDQVMEGAAGAAVFRVVTPDYFRAMGIRVLQGRTFDSRDNEGAPAAIVNLTFAAHRWPGRSPIGQRIKNGSPESTAPWMTVVGVVADVRQFHLREPSRPEVYVPVTQPHPAWVAPSALVIRVSGDPGALEPGLREALRSVDRTLPRSDVRPMADLVRASGAQLRFYATVLGLLGTTALTLAGVGVFGVMAYNVSRRTREIGVRLAVGASGRAIVGMVIGQGVALTATGLALGLGGALLLTRYLGTQLYGIAATDPRTFGWTIVVLLGTAMAACAVPALRAARVDPIRSLRSE